MSLIAYVYIEKIVGQGDQSAISVQTSRPLATSNARRKAPGLAEKTAAAHLGKAERAKSLREHDRKSTGADFN
jgi:hypothetical protein